MSKSNTFENAILELFFKGTTIADLAENDTTSPATNLYVSLHTGNPDETGNQATNETAYTGYERVAVSRSTGWTVTGNSVSPAANIDFGECTASPGSAIQYFGIGTNATKGQAGYLMYYGTVTPNITMAAGVIPRLKTTSTVTED